MSKKSLVSVLILFLSAALFAKGKKDTPPKPLYFDETWGYVSMSRAEEYSDDLPLTDVCYFAADVNCYGELIDIPDISKIPVSGKRRHLVFICDSRSLTHFVLSPEYDVREKVIDQLVKACEPFDGLNVDLELVPARDEGIYLSFLSELRAKLPGKMLSVCVPARVKTFSGEVYHYDRIQVLCDRVFVMAYDEHWGGGKPGPVASAEWCKNVTDFAKKYIPEEKLIMGIPFYGRTWVETNHAKAWYYSSIQKVMNENHVTDVKYENGIPNFSYKAEVKVTGFYNDSVAVHGLAQMYQNAGIGKIGYWRIGQEDPEVWKLILTK